MGYRNFFNKPTFISLHFLHKSGLDFKAEFYFFFKYCIATLAARLPERAAVSIEHGR